MLTARIQMNRLLEDDEDFDVRAAVDRLTSSGIPGVELEREGNHWNVYLKKGHEYMGDIYYSPLTGAAGEPEPGTPGHAYLSKHPWFVLGTVRGGDRRCESMTDALQFLAGKYRKKLLGVHESTEEDNPEFYTHPNRFSKQPAMEPLESSLRIMLRPYYDKVVIRREPGTFSFGSDGYKSFLDENWNWSVHCTRSEGLLPLPRLMRRNDGLGTEVMDAPAWKRHVKGWLLNWAEQNGIAVLYGQIDITGRLRKDPTFTFQTYRPRPVAESSEDDIPAEQLLAGLVKKVDWEHDLDMALWAFHSTGVGYRVHSLGGRNCIVLAETYFEPDRDDFANRFRAFVVDWLTKHNLASGEAPRLYVYKLEGREDYPHWVVALTVGKLPELFPASAERAAPVEIGQPTAAV